MRFTSCLLLALATGCSPTDTAPGALWSVGDLVDVDGEAVPTGWELMLTDDLYPTGPGAVLPDELVLPLPDGTTLEVDRSRAGSTPDRTWWAGDAGEYEVVLSTFQGAISGNIRGPKGTWEVRNNRLGGLLLEVPPGTYPTEGIPLGGGMGASTDGSIPMDGGVSVVDVLVVYTDAAVEGAGGEEALHSELYLAISETNEGLVRSEAETQLRVVGMEPVDYDETDFDFREALPSLQADGDGVMDEVHDLREEVGADHVLLIAEHEFLDVCGLSYIQSPADPSFAPWAFSAAARLCAAGNLTAGHELGHAMGSVHDPINTNNEGAFSWSHGHKDADAGWRTVMALNGRSPQDEPAPRVNRWSNPTHKLDGAQLGADDADNADSLSQVAAISAQFAASVVHGAEIVTPTPGSELAATSVHFTWTDTGSDASLLTLGTALGADDLFREVTMNTELEVTGLPADGTPVYARLWVQVDGTWVYSDAAYTSFDEADVEPEDDDQEIEAGTGRRPEVLPGPNFEPKPVHAPRPQGTPGPQGEPGPSATPAELVVPDPGQDTWTDVSEIRWSDTGAGTYRVLVFDEGGKLVLNEATDEIEVEAPTDLSGPVTVKLLTQSGTNWFARSYDFVVSP